MTTRYSNSETIRIYLAGLRDAVLVTCHIQHNDGTIP